MSSTPTGNTGEGNAFPFTNENQNNQWPALSIIGIVVTVLGFIAVTWFIFWIFRREKRLRRSATAGVCSPEPTHRES
jgi:predicted permease